MTKRKHRRKALAIETTAPAVLETPVTPPVADLPVGGFPAAQEGSTMQVDTERPTRTPGEPPPREEPPRREEPPGDRPAKEEPPPERRPDRPQ